MERKSSAVRREEIVRAALSLIATDGPGALTTPAIALAVGVSQGAVFRHFTTKLDILIACVDWIGDQVHGAVTSAAARPGTAEKRLRHIVAALLTVAKTIPAMPTTMFSRELHAEFPQLHEHLRERRRRFHAVLEELLADGVARGEFAAGLDIEAAAHLVFGMVHSLLFRWHHFDREFDLDRQGAVMVGLLLDGLKRR